MIPYFQTRWRCFRIEFINPVNRRWVYSADINWSILKLHIKEGNEIDIYLNFCTKKVQFKISLDNFTFDDACSYVFGVHLVVYILLDNFCIYMDDLLLKSIIKGIVKVNKCDDRSHKCDQQKKFWQKYRNFKFRSKYAAKKFVKRFCSKKQRKILQSQLSV